MKAIYYLNVSLFKKKMHVEVVCFAFKLSRAMPYLQPGGGVCVCVCLWVGGGQGTPVRGTDQWNWNMCLDAILA